MITVVTNNLKNVDAIDYEQSDAVMLVVCRNHNYTKLKKHIMTRCSEYLIPFYLYFVIPETKQITEDFLHGLGTTIDPETVCIFTPESSSDGQQNPSGV